MEFSGELYLHCSGSYCLPRRAPRASRAALVKNNRRRPRRIVSPYANSRESHYDEVLISSMTMTRVHFHRAYRSSNKWAADFLSEPSSDPYRDRSPIDFPFVEFRRPRDVPSAADVGRECCPPPRTSFFPAWTSFVKRGDSLQQTTQCVPCCFIFNYVRRPPAPLHLRVASRDLSPRSEVWLASNFRKSKEARFRVTIDHCTGRGYISFSWQVTKFPDAIRGIEIFHSGTLLVKPRPFHSTLYALGRVKIHGAFHILRDNFERCTLRRTFFYKRERRTRDTRIAAAVR